MVMAGFSPTRGTKSIYSGLIPVPREAYVASEVEPESSLPRCGGDNPLGPAFCKESVLGDVPPNEGGTCDKRDFLCLPHSLLTEDLIP